MFWTSNHVKQPPINPEEAKRAMEKAIEIRNSALKYRVDASIAMIEASECEGSAVLDKMTTYVSPEDAEIYAIRAERLRLNAVQLSTRASQQAIKASELMADAQEACRKALLSTDEGDTINPETELEQSIYLLEKAVDLANSGTRLFINNFAVLITIRLKRSRGLPENPDDMKYVFLQHSLGRKMINEAREQAESLDFPSNPDRDLTTKDAPNLDSLRYRLLQVLDKLQYLGGASCARDCSEA